MNARFYKRFIQTDFALVKIGYALLLMSIPFAIPFSVGSHTVEILSEPLMVFLSLLLLPIIWKRREKYQKYWQSPIFICSFLWLLSVILSVLTSIAPIISIKYAIISGLHWFLFFYVPLSFSIPLKNIIEKYYNFYCLPLILILFYAWINHSQYDFSIATSASVARPFYTDHAILSAGISLLLGIYTAKFINLIKQYNQDELQGKDSMKTSLYGLILICLLIGVLLASSRAAWLAILLSCCFTLFVFLYKYYVRWLLLLGALSLSLGLLLIPRFSSFIATNKIVAKQGNWRQHILSATNISSDASNLERLNRYSCAIRMFKDRPLTGFGAGTYPSAYLPYQKEAEMTRISVTDIGPHLPGRGGGAHSEYLQYFAELGIFGGFFFLCLIFFSLKISIQTFLLTDDIIRKNLILGLLFGLTTFWVHGIFNNFLHESKISVLLWSSLAIIIKLNEE